jgi:hypothetical protein
MAFLTFVLTGYDHDTPSIAGWCRTLFDPGSV